MLADDIAEMYELLVEQVSIIRIVDDQVTPMTKAPAPAPGSSGPIDLTK